MQTAGEPEAITGINITPLVDIILVLLIIFMATAPLLHRRGLNVSLPKSSKSDRLATETRRVEYDAGRRLLLDGERMSLSELAARLRLSVEAEPATHVAVAAQESIPYGDVVAVLDEIKGAGVKRIGLEVRRK